MADLFKTPECLGRLSGLLLICTYFFIISLDVVHDQPYLWLTVTFVIVLCLTTVICSKDAPIIPFRRATPVQVDESERIRREDVLQEGQIWTTDIPPSYSCVMGNCTPPPTYGSALFLIRNENEKKQGEALVPAETPMIRQLLETTRNMRSASRQVSLSQRSDAGEDWESGIIMIAVAAAQNNDDGGNNKGPPSGGAINQPRKSSANVDAISDSLSVTTRY